MLLTRQGERLRAREVLFWAFTWALGAGSGVALGGWLTVVGGAGAPGAEALDVRTDLIVLPLAVFAIVGALHVCGQLVSALLRGRAHDHGRHDEDEQGTRRDEVPGDIEAERASDG